MTAELSPILANALQFAFDKATMEGKITIGSLLLVSFISWTVMINKARQLFLARRQTKKFVAAWRQTRDPLELMRAWTTFHGSPEYAVYAAGTEELAYHLKNNPVEVRSARPIPAPGVLVDGVHTDHFAKASTTRISTASFESVMVAQERAVSASSLSLERGMIILSTAVAGGPFIGLLGTVWGVMETFAGVAQAASANLQVMAPGVAGALIATVVGLFVAIPAMFAYNYMITMIRGITQEVDNFNSELSIAVEHRYVDNRPLAEEIRDALMESGMAGRTETFARS